VNPSRPPAPVVLLRDACTYQFRMKTDFKDERLTEVVEQDIEEETPVEEGIEASFVASDILGGPQIMEDQSVNELRRRQPARNRRLPARFTEVDMERRQSTRNIRRGQNPIESVSRTVAFTVVGEDSLSNLGALGSQDIEVETPVEGMVEVPFLTSDNVEGSQIMEYQSMNQLRRRQPVRNRRLPIRYTEVDTERRQSTRNIRRGLNSMERASRTVSVTVVRENYLSNLGALGSQDIEVETPVEGMVEVPFVTSDNVEGNQIVEDQSMNQLRRRQPARNRRLPIRYTEVDIERRDYWSLGLERSRICHRCSLNSFTNATK